MVQGAASDAGERILATDLRRVLRRKGVKVVPFKPQNIALNRIVGTCIHGLFDSANARNALPGWISLTNASSDDMLAVREADVDRLADSSQQHLDLAEQFTQWIVL